MQHAPALPSHQCGLSLLGFIFSAAILVMLAIVAMKMVPAYIEFYAVKRILMTMDKENELGSMSNAEIRKDFTRRAGADFISAVKAEDLTITRTADNTLVNATYEFRTGLVGNVSLVIDFDAVSNPATAASAVE